MNGNRPWQITAKHLLLLAILYLRQSTPRQVRENTGSTGNQRHQIELARVWGWPEGLILEIDEDLGRSGVSGGHRSGWKRMLKLVEEGRVGIIFVSDVSRLSRSYRDFAELADLCETNAVLLVADGRIVDFDDSTDQFMAYIYAGLAQLDNKLRKKKLLRDGREKARQGHAVRRPPTGYVVAQKGHWVKDPDCAVQRAIEGIFRDFQIQGTIGKLLRHYWDHDIKLPVRVAGDLRWVKPYRVRIHGILTNPAYKGAYSFGRRVIEKGHLVRQKNPEAVIVYEGLHDAYIDPAGWDRIQRQLYSNNVRRIHKDPTVYQPAGEGPALVQGIIKCGKCGKTMLVHYGNRQGNRLGITYACCLDRAERGGPLCWSVNGERVDETVTAELLRTLQPPELEAVIAAAADVNVGYAAVCRQREAELQQAQYAVTIAKRRYELVDPANRRLAVTLERDYNQALDSRDVVERQQAEDPPVPPLVPTPESIAAIHQFAHDLPALWTAPSTSHGDRKTLLRLFIRQVRITNLNDITFDIEIHWIGGAITRHTIFHPYGPARLARQLKAQGWDAGQIAEELKRRGARTMYRRKPFTAEHIEAIFRNDAKGRSPKNDKPWRRRREELRPILEELVQGSRLTDASVAAEFIRRGIPPFSPRRPWNKGMILRLRDALGIPSARSHNTQREGLRRIVTELCKVLPEDADIAAELERRGIPGLRGDGKWTEGRVSYLRARLGLQPRRGRLCRVGDGSTANEETA